MSGHANKFDVLDQVIGAILSEKTARTDCSFFPAHGVVSKELVQDFYRISNTTLLAWQKLGLTPVGPGTRSYFYFCEDVLRFLRANPRNNRLRPKPKRKTRLT